MTKKKLITLKDYINALKRLQKVAHDLEDIDKDMGGQLSGMDASDSDNLIEKNKSTNERKLTAEIEKLLSKNSQLREINLVQFKKFK